MRLSEYSDDDLLKEVKLRGFEVMLISGANPITNKTLKISIGGVVFELTS